MGPPGTLRLTIPAYDMALDALKASIVEGMVGVDPMLGQIESRTTGHAGPIRNVPGPNPVGHDRTHFEGGYAIPFDAIRETDADAFITAICGVAEQYAAVMGTTFFRTARDITDATGNSIDAGGRPLSWDLILNGLEGTDITFDDDGHPTTQIVASPNSSRPTMLDEQGSVESGAIEILLFHVAKQPSPLKKSLVADSEAF